jgi:hypothetical protein
MQVQLTGTNINASNVPIVAITAQSTNPSFLRTANGIIGLAYATLSDYPLNGPRSMIDAFVSSGSTKNRIAFKMCPYALLSYSWIDFGASTPYRECGSNGPLAITISPSKTYLTVNVVGLYVNAERIALPAVFQTSDPSQIGSNGKAWSILDSCSSSTLILCSN